MNFSWKNLEKPFFVLAPMEGATDTVFRQIVATCGRPDVFFTEFASVEGLTSERGFKQVSKKLKYTENERPLIAQIWGKTPEKYAQSTKMIREMGFDGVDINMGCPDRTVIKNGCCSALIENPTLAREIIQAVKEGASSGHPADKVSELLVSGSNTFPVSVKTRIGLRSIKTEEWIEFLLQQNLAALTVHLRTATEMSKVAPHWEEMRKVIALRDKIAPHTVIIGNGDLFTLQEAKDKIKEYGFDGAMLGRAIFQNPWLFTGKLPDEFDGNSKLKLLKHHLELYESTWGEEKSFYPLKKYFKIYANGFDGASELREKLMETNTYEEAKALL